MLINAEMEINGTWTPVRVETNEYPPGVSRDDYQELARKVNTLENRVTNHMGDSMRMNLSGMIELISAIQRGQKIQAIKALRTATPGMGLKEAKELVESGWNSHLADHANSYEPSF